MSFMKLTNTGDNGRSIAEKLGRSYWGGRAEPVAAVQKYVERLYLEGKGPPDFRAWFDARFNGRPEEAKEAAIVVAQSSAVEREEKALDDTETIFSLRRTIEKQATRIAQQEARIAELNKEWVGGSDEIRRKQLEINAAKNAQRDAEYTLKNAMAKIESAEERVREAEARTCTKDHGDQQKLATLQSEITRLSSLLTRRENKLHEVEVERNEKDTALRAAISRAQRAETEAKRAVVPSLRVVEPPSSSRSAVDVGDSLQALIDAGVMTSDEAFAKLRRAR